MLDFLSIHQERPLTQDECLKLRDAICESDDYGNLLSWIYIFGYSCKPDGAVIKKLESYLRYPVPGLTAIAMRVLIDFWSMLDSYENCISYFLTIAENEDWHEEVAFSFHFVERNLEYGWSDELIEKFNEINSDPKLVGRIK